MSSHGPALATRSIAFHLPQFHPIAENDEWWGAGFTEWRNVAAARPRFAGHYQPHVPADLGFYDLRLTETRVAQAELATRYGISGFCYYHYWFNGRRLLERPVNDLLRTGQPDFPFMLCWANENWSRRWDGSERDMLVEQIYSEQDDLDHIRALAPYLADPRYIRTDGKPVFAVYRTTEFPDIRRTTDTWRAEADRLGLGELYLCRIEGFHGQHSDPRALGFDAAVQFQPNQTLLPARIEPAKFTRAARRVLRPKSGYRWNNVYSYPDYVAGALAKPLPSYVRFPGVMPSWDNSARRKQWAMIFRDSTPAAFEQWVLESLRSVQGTESDRFLFINAWNEWAEGAHMEPDLRFGHGYLQAHRSAQQRFTHEASKASDCSVQTDHAARARYDTTTNGAINE